jgi:hypothetical protein
VSSGDCRRFADLSRGCGQHGALGQKALLHAISRNSRTMRT